MEWYQVSGEDETIERVDAKGYTGYIDDMVEERETELTCKLSQRREVTSDPDTLRGD